MSSGTAAFQRLTSMSACARQYSLVQPAAEAIYAKVLVMVLQAYMEFVLLHASTSVPPTAKAQAL